MEGLQCVALVYPIVSPFRYATGWFYCGETDNVKGRLKFHRTPSPTRFKHRGKRVDGRHGP